MVTGDPPQPVGAFRISGGGEPDLIDASASP